MPAWNIIQAVNDALRIAMRRDPRVVVMGEDVGKFGGVFRATLGLIEEFGAARVIDTPLAEAGIIGAAIGMAMYGLRPVPEIQFSDFIFPAFDQIVNELAKLRYRSGGQYSAPVVIRTPVGGGIKGGHYHSQSPEALFIHTPGLQVICPSNPVDAKGLLISAIRQDDPVIFMEPKRVYRAAKGEVPEGEYTVPIGEGVVEGEIVKWLVKAGDQIVEDQPLVEVMTDKATVTIPSPRRGQVVRTVGNEGDIAKVHSTLVVLELEGGGAVQATPSTGAPAQAAPPLPPGEAGQPAPLLRRKGVGSIGSRRNYHGCQAPGRSGAMRSSTDSRRRTNRTCEPSTSTSAARGREL